MAQKRPPERYGERSRGSLERACVIGAEAAEIAGVLQLGSLEAVSRSLMVSYLVSQKREVVVDHHLQQRDWPAGGRVLAFLR